jgi:crotonobetainyl-CoA:carnitine CoA-transferase CaiB-like acyl-CoA transferase
LLAPYRVLDLTDERGFMAGRILADLGADVVKIEPAGGDRARHQGPYWGGAVGDPDRSLAWIPGNVGKRSIVLDLLQSDSDRDQLRALAAGADVILESFAPGAMTEWGVGYEALTASLPSDHPGLVYCAITPFGQTGPYSDFSGHDLVAVALGGNASMTGDPQRAPLRCTLPTAYIHAGPEAVVGIVMALYARQELGAGQLVDVSLHETQLSTLITGAGQQALTHRPAKRTGHRTGRTREIWRCKDGWISYGLRGGPARAPSLQATVAYMAEGEMAPDWLREYDWSSYSPLAIDNEELARMESAFGAFFATKSMRELYEQALSRRILLAPCNNAREILDQPQLRSRGFFRRIEHPALAGSLELPDCFARSSLGRIGIRGPAPSLDEHADEIRAELAGSPRRAGDPQRSPDSPLDTRIGERGLFEGLRILELGSGAAGPAATRYFSEQGARVIRIESSKRPDFLRMLHLTATNRDEPGILEQAPMFVLLNPNKESVAINMKSPVGVALVQRLVDQVDVVAENFAPGVMEKWGLDYARLQDRHPRLVMLSGCLFGQTGPQRSYPGFGGQGAAIAGFNQLTGWPDGEALGPYATITDSLAPRYAAAALGAALLHLRHTGEGQHIDLSQIEAGIHGLSEMIARYSGNGEVMMRAGNQAEHAAPHAIYPCRNVDGDERWIAIAVHDETAWQALVSAMGSPAWASEARYAALAARLTNVDALDAQMAEWTREQAAEPLMHTLQAAGVEAGVVRDFEQLLEDPQLAARGHFVRLHHGPLGDLLFERPGFRLSATPGGLDRPGPQLGEHTHAALGELLGLSTERLDELVREEVLL